MPQHNDPAVSSTLLRAARALTDFQTLAGTLDAIVHATRDTVPGFDHVGISVLHRAGTIETQAADGVALTPRRVTGRRTT